MNCAWLRQMQRHKKLILIVPLKMGVSARRLFICTPLFLVFLLAFIIFAALILTKEHNLRLHKKGIHVYPRGSVSNLKQNRKLFLKHKHGKLGHEKHHGVKDIHHGMDIKNDKMHISKDRIAPEGPRHHAKKVSSMTGKLRVAMQVAIGDKNGTHKKNISLHKNDSSNIAKRVYQKEHQEVIEKPVDESGSKLKNHTQMKSHRNITGLGIRIKDHFGLKSKRNTTKHLKTKTKLDDHDNHYIHRKDKKYNELENTKTRSDGHDTSYIHRKDKKDKALENTKTRMDDHDKNYIHRKDKQYNELENTKTRLDGHDTNYNHKKDKKENALENTKTRLDDYDKKYIHRKDKQYNKLENTKTRLDGHDTNHIHRKDKKDNALENTKTRLDGHDKKYINGKDQKDSALERYYKYRQKYSPNSSKNATWVKAKKKRRYNIGEKIDKKRRDHDSPSPGLIYSNKAQNRLTNATKNTNL